MKLVRIETHEAKDGLWAVCRFREEARYTSGEAKIRRDDEFEVTVNLGTKLTETKNGLEIVTSQISFLIEEEQKKKGE